MAKKPLITHAELLEALDYDPGTGVFRWKHRADRSKSWNTRYAGKIAGWISDNGYLIITLNGKDYRAHRVAIFYVTGEWPRDEIDHRHGKRLDNRFSELREATHAQNGRNSKKRSHNTSGVKGVCWHKQRNKWKAEIRKDGRAVHLGLFTNIEDAARAYREAADRLHGEFARHE